MADRYVVMSIAEARASGKRAAGFLSRARAESCAALLNSRPPGRYASQAPRWWKVGESDTHAIVDTATAADGSPGESERRPCEGWTTVNRGTADERHRIDLVLLNPNAAGAFSKREAMTLNLDPYGERDGDGPDGHLVSLRVGNGWLPDIEEADADKAKMLAESAAAALLADALLALGETGREAMRRAMEGRK